MKINKKIARIISFLVDMMIVKSFSDNVTNFFIDTLLVIPGDSFMTAVAKLIGLLAIPVFVWLVYAIFMHQLFSATFGKFIFKIDVVDQKNKKPKLKQIAIREFTKISMLIGTFGIYGIYCLYCIIKAKPMYHENTTNTHIK